MADSDSSSVVAAAESSDPLLPIVESEWSPQPEPQELRLEFFGDADEFFRIWIVNVCLTLLSLGIFSAWAKVRRQRYFYVSTCLEGTPFEYTGRPLPILKGRLIAAGLVGIWYLLEHFYPAIAPFVYLAAALVAPWVIVKSMAFRAHATAFRNMRFSFDGSIAEATKLIYSFVLVTLFTLGLGYAYLEQRVRRYLITHTSFGGATGQFTANGNQFLGVNLKAGLIAVATMLTLIAVTMFVPAVRAHLEAASVVWTYTMILIVYAYRQTRIFNLCWENTRFGGLLFESDLTFRGMLRLYLTNGLAIAATAGLLIPWAMVRSARYRIEHTRVYLYGSFEQFSASSTSNVHAVGAELADAFDWDLAF